MKLRTFFFIALSMIALHGSAFAAPQYRVTVVPNYQEQSVSFSAMNEHGQFVGNWQTSEGESRAVYWDGISADIRDLGTLAGGMSVATAINSTGQIIGYSRDDYGQERAVLWNPGEPIRDLGTLGGLSARANGINNAGQIVGWSGMAEGLSRAFLWEAGTGIAEIAGVGGFASQAYGINDAGQIRGGYLTRLGDPRNNPNRSFLRDTDGTIFDLGDLGRDGTDNFDMNASGQVVGWSSSGENQYRAYRWSKETGIRSLGALVPDALGSIARRVNNNGWAVGDSSSNAGGGGHYHVLWDGDGKIRRFAPALSGSLLLNNANQVVGSGADGTPFLLKNGVTYDLNALLAPESSQWRVSGVSHFNDMGQMVAGASFAGEPYRTVILTPVTVPEAQSGVLLAGAAAFGIAVARRRR